MGNRFSRYDLRTTDIADASAFYEDVVGLEVVQVENRVELRSRGCLIGEMTSLPELARAGGAPPHWLGYIGVPDVEATTRSFVSMGAARLGPQRVSANGREAAILRDPFGTVLALTSEVHADEMPALAWHDLNTFDQARAAAMYAELFGWVPTETFEIGGDYGTYQSFTWREDARSVGGIVGSARLPGVHPHFLFYFEVADIELSIARVKSRGGTVVSPHRSFANGVRLAYCEDAQRAAFGLLESS